MSGAGINSRWRREFSSRWRRRRTSRSSSRSSPTSTWTKRATGVGYGTAGVHHHPPARVGDRRALGGDHAIYWFAPLVADAEAGFGGPLHAFEIMKNMIAEGAAGVHFESRLASVKKCGHLGGKVLVPTSEFITKLIAARVAADVCGVDTILVARTDANSATLLTSDCDEYDRRFVTGERTAEGFSRVRDGVEAAIARALAYAPYADLLWFETSKPDLKEATRFADAIHEKFPGKQLAYNCSPSFNWRKHLSEAQIASFQKDLGALGYKFQFVTPFA